MTLVFLLASGSMVESYNQVFGWYKGVHRGHHSYHDHHGYHGYRHYGHYGSRPFGHPGEDNVGSESPIGPSSQGDPGGSGFAGGPVGIPSF